MERRWLLTLGPPLVATLALALLGSTSVGAGDRGWDPPPCPGGLAALAAAATRPDTSPEEPPVPDAWFTIDARLDDSGALAGQRLRLGLGSQRARYVDLPAESAAAGPFGRVVLLVADDARRSEIRAIDPRAACAWRVGSSTDVIRRVTLDPAATSAYEFRVDRVTRADLGVWRRPLHGSGASRVLGPLPADGRFGRTFTTTLGWSLDDGRLIVQQCGAAACRTRLLDPATGEVVMLDRPGQGELLGVAEGQAIGYAACGALPCDVEATALAGSGTATLAQGSGLAALVATVDGARLVVETAGGGEIRRLDGSIDGDAPRPSRDARLVPSLHGATAGHGLPAGWVAWAPDGRSPEGATLTRLGDGWSVDVAEVMP